MTSATPTVTFTKTRPGGGRGSSTSEYSALLHTIRDAGLLRRRTGFYWLMFSGITLALGGAVTGFILLGDSWFQLLIAGALGVILTQYAFLAHEAAHRQVFTSGKPTTAPDVRSRTCSSASATQWWMTKHSRHHANPNIRRQGPRHRAATSSRSPRRMPHEPRDCTAGPHAVRAGCSSPRCCSRASTCTSTASARCSHAARSTSALGRDHLMLVTRRRRVRRGHLPVLAARDGVRLPRRAARGVRRLHGRILRPQPQGHADPAARLARSTSCAARC